MSVPSISTHEFRKRLAEFMDLAYYKNRQVRVERKGRPMARLVGEPFMEALEQLFETEPGLEDTLELMLDGEAMEALHQGEKEIKEGKLIPLEEAFAD